MRSCLFSDRFQVLQRINRPCLKRPDDIRRITALVHLDNLFRGDVRSASLRSQSQTCPSACPVVQRASLLSRIHEPTPALKALRSAARLSHPRVARYRARPLLDSGSRNAFELCRDCREFRVEHGAAARANRDQNFDPTEPEGDIEMSAPGKWGLPDFPNRDWTCVAVEDLGDVDAVCQMCEVKEIRYVHIVEHPDGLSLGAGCVCAGKMEGSPNAPVQRERSLKNRARRLQNWLSAAWKQHPKGTLTRTKNGCRCVLVPQPGNVWDGLVEYPNGKKQWSRRSRPLNDQKRKMFTVVDSVP